MKGIRQAFRDLSAPAEVITHRHSRGDWGVAVLLGCVASALAALWPSPIVHPDVWNEVAIAAGTRPPELIAGGVWRMLAGALFRLLGAEGGMTALLWGGRLALGASVAFCFLLLRTLLPVHLGVCLRDYVRMRHLFRLTMGIAALLFGCSEPVWRVFQQMGPDAVTVLLSLAVLWLVHVFLHQGRRWVLAVAFAFCGFLTAESSLGLPLTLFVLFLLLRARYHGGDPLSLLQNPFATEQLKWGMSFAFGLAFVGSIGLDFIFFLGHEGLEASGEDPRMLAFAWLRQWWGGVTGLATTQVWVCGILLTLVPFLLTLMLLRGATDTENFLTYRLAGFFLLIGGGGLLSLSGIPKCWFWMWSGEGESLKSAALGALFMFFSAGGVMGALAVAGVECWCRDYAHVVQRFGGDPLRMDVARRGAFTLKTVLAASVHHLLFLLLPGIALASAILARHRVCERRMMGMIDEFVKETVREMGPTAKWLFTDGGFDGLIEFWSQAVGGGVRALSLMAPKSDYTVFLCRRTAGDSEDGKVMGGGALGTLRFWAREKTMRMKQTAVQLGFEVWRSGEEQGPCPLGVLAHGGEVPEAEVKRARGAAREMSERVLAFYLGGEGGIHACADRALRQAFLGVQWRLSRIAHQRAAEALRHEDMALARVEQKLSTRLDEANPAFVDLRKRLENIPTEAGLVLTPREGLSVSLKRRDYRMARRFAEIVLRGDPGNPHANYAMGMDCMTVARWNDAVRFFERVLEKKTDDPTIMNNIAVCRWKAGRLEEALDWVERALKADPEAQDIRHNRARIQSDLSKRGNATPAR